MKPQKHYIQVWIDGKEENLPKECKEIIYHRIDHAGMPSGIIVSMFNPIDENYWLKHMDWYLAEVEQPKGLTDAEGKLFILDMLKLNKSIEIDGKKFYPEESVINIIKQLLKTET